MLAEACQPGCDLVPTEPNYLRGDKCTWVEGVLPRKIKLWCDLESVECYRVYLRATKPADPCVGKEDLTVSHKTPKQGRRGNKISCCLVIYCSMLFLRADVSRNFCSHGVLAMRTSWLFGQDWEVLSALERTHARNVRTAQQLCKRGIYPAHLAAGWDV